MECLDIWADLDIVETLEMNFDSCKKKLMEFREIFSKWIYVLLTQKEMLTAPFYLESHV